MTTRIAVLGGGNGISAVLSGLASRVRDGVPLSVSAIVATADDGGSSGRLRVERGGIPPGDLRSCLLALASEKTGPFRRLFAHRYDGQGDLAGHSLGNLILAALAEQEGSYLRAVEVAGEMLAAHGRVLPVSLRDLHLEAQTRDGARISGESRIGRSPCAVHRVWLEPEGAEPAAGVVEAIHGADVVVLGPGSLFTSLLAVLLVPGVADAVRSCPGERVLVSNLMTQPGETLDMTLSDHLEALDRHVGDRLVGAVLAHSADLDPARLGPYGAQGSVRIAPSFERTRTEDLLVENLVTTSGKIRHDPDRLAGALLALATGRRSRVGPPSRS